MVMKHSATGAGLALQPASGTQSPLASLSYLADFAHLADFAAFFVNDNITQVASPPRDCVGLVLSREEDTTGISHLTIRLYFKHGLDDYPLLATQDARAIITLWQGMGKDFSLPLYLRNENGEIVCVRAKEDQSSYPRRLGSPLSGRRPRFLTRRRSPLTPYMQQAAP